MNEGELMAMADTIPIQDHLFVIADGPDRMPIEIADSSTGLAGVMPSAALIHTGVNTGTVTVRAAALDARPPIETHGEWLQLAQEWEDVVEISLFAVAGTLGVHRLSYGPFDSPPDLPVLSAHGQGHYRLRIHARGRDRQYDKDVDESVEEYLVLSWPAEPSPSLIVRTTSHCGYGLRLWALGQPVAPPPPQSLSPEEEADAAIRAQQLEALQRNLEGR